ncbi:MAG: amidase [Gemmatimonadaceae bacterium]
MPRLTYDLKSLTLPRLAGFPLRAVAWLLEHSATRWILLGRLLRDAGFTRFRDIVVDDPPTFMPPVDQQQPARPVSALATDAEDLAKGPRSCKDGFIYASVSDYTQAYASGTLTPEDVASRILDAIAASDAQDPPLRAFVATNREDALSQARESSKRFKEGRTLGSLDGVPIAVKDEIDQTPYGTTFGTRFLGRAPAREDSTVVARLRAAGALLIGKTNMHEIGIGVTGLNVFHGTPRNPHDPRYHSGGSSSGSAAAVSAGLCPVAIGADGGGSIRIPSAFCGVVGLKPTFGRVSAWSSSSLCWSVAHVGPIAACVRDAALVYAEIAGPDARDPSSLTQPLVIVDQDSEADLSGIVLGIYWPWFRHASPAVVSVCERMVGYLQDAGAELREVKIPELDAARMAQLVTITSEMVAALEPHEKHPAREYSPEVRLNLALARTFTSLDYLKAQRIRTRTAEHFTRALADVHAIVTPTTACVAPLIRPGALASGESDLSVVTEIMRYVTPANMTGLPAISFPAGYDDTGLPIGFQAIGRAWDEHVLIRIAAAAERVVERNRPHMLYEPLRAA